jgi:hypothetical protein
MSSIKPKSPGPKVACVCGYLFWKWHPWPELWVCNKCQRPYRGEKEQSMSEENEKEEYTEAHEDYADVITYPIDDARLEQAFTYHPPAGDDQVARYNLLRDQARTMASNVMQFTQSSREQSLALTKIEEAVMWANAAIARNESGGGS